jgi:uncharacterized protein YbaR (Trm112 family)
MVCLECRSPLRDGGDHLECTDCGLRYPVEDGSIPVMLAEEAYRPEDEQS